MTEESKKIYILDTSVLIHDPEAIYEFNDNHLVIPIAVLEELDGLKKAPGDLGFSAREASRNLDKVFRDVGSDDISSGIRIKSGGTLRFDLNNNSYELLPSVMERSKDNSIILAAIRIKKEHPETRVVVVSKDINMRLKAIALQVEAEDYEADKVKDIDALYAGIDDLILPENVLANFYQHNKLSKFRELYKRYGEGSFFPNKCFRVSSTEDGKFALVRYIQELDSIIWVNTPDFFKNQRGAIKPINDEQILAYAMATDLSIELLSLFGPPGTGKTLMALLAGYNQLDVEYEKILVFRATKEIGEPLGFLPGTKEEKMAPWARPITTSLKLIAGGGKQDRGFGEHDKGGMFEPELELMRYGHVEVLSLNNIRGDTFHDTYVIIDDAQNLTQHQMKAVLTRAGKGSKYVLTGDLDQIDDHRLDAHSSGLTKVLSVFPGEESYGQLNLLKGERSSLANTSARLL
jgi:PhoH-like ATPase